MNRLSRATVIGLAFWIGAAFADAPEVTPYRPTVSNPAALSAPGLLELEAGVARSHDDRDTRQLSVPYLLKYAFTENFGVLLGGDAYLQQKDAFGNRITGFGDTEAQIKLRHELTENMALGLETGVRLATARTGLGSEKSDYIVNGIFSAAGGGFNVDINLGYTRLGSVDAGQSHDEIDWATAVSGKLGGPWGWATELSGTGQHNASSTTQALAALTYQPSRTLIFDLGVSRELKQPNETAVFGGLVILFDHR